MLCYLVLTHRAQGYVVLHGVVLHYMAMLCYLVILSTWLRCATWCCCRVVHGYIVLPCDIELYGYVVLPGVVVLVEMRQVVEVGEHKLHTGAPLLQPQLKDLECNALVLHTNILIMVFFVALFTNNGPDLQLFDIE
jgi:hypothetical protein